MISRNPHELNRLYTDTKATLHFIDLIKRSFLFRVARTEELWRKRASKILADLTLLNVDVSHSEGIDFNKLVGVSIDPLRKAWDLVEQEFNQLDQLVEPIVFQSHRELIIKNRDLTVRNVGLTQQVTDLQRQIEELKNATVETPAE